MLRVSVIKLAHSTRSCKKQIVGHGVEHSVMMRGKIHQVMWPKLSAWMGGDGGWDGWATGRPWSWNICHSVTLSHLKLLELNQIILFVLNMHKDTLNIKQWFLYSAYYFILQSPLYEKNDMGVHNYNVFFGKCQKVSIYKECLICDFLPKNELFLSQSLGDSIINKF